MFSHKFSAQYRCNVFFPSKQFQNGNATTIAACHQHQHLKGWINLDGQEMWVNTSVPGAAHDVSRWVHWHADNNEDALFLLWCLWTCNANINLVILHILPASRVLMHSSAKLQSLPLSVLSFCSCNKVYHKPEKCFLLYLLGQVVTWHHNPNSLD